MFSIELKFTTDCLKFWFERNLKKNELDEDERDQFIKDTPKKTCCICDFPIKSRAANGWFDHVCKAEYLFLENIFSAKEMFQMGISTFDIYFGKIKKILDSFDDFCEDIEHKYKISILEDEQNLELENTIQQINNIKIKGEDGVTKKKIIAFLYTKTIHFLPTDKIDTAGFLASEKFLDNLFFIHKDQHVVHHSHVTGKIIGHAHEFCNLKIKEVFYTIPVIAHNQFRFDFFLFLKVLRSSVWETTDINIGGKNPTNVTFAIIQNQVRFIDTVKYYQQSLASLASSMTDIERANVRKNCRKFLAEKLMYLTDEDEQWVLDYLSSGKGMIPYQMITDFNSLEIVPKADFFDKKELKEKDISDEEYQNVKKFFMLLKLKTLGDMNRIYNFQDTLILCEIFEQRVSLLEKLFKFNPRKCNSASSFTGAVHRNKSKCNIVMPTNAEQIRVFEKTLIGGYSCVNTMMAFDTEIFLKYKVNEKVIFKTRDGQLKRFSSKIIKMDENNQYGFAMTKPLPYGCIKKKKNLPTLEELSVLLENVILEDKLGHLFVVDIGFADINEKTLLFNEIYPPIFEKNKKIEPYERSCKQIMSRAAIKKNKKKEDTLYSLPFNSKTHATLKKKIFISLYAEDLYFLTTCAGWKVTRIYDHYTFMQDTFKKDFVVMNQNARKTAKTKVEKDFCKLLNNSNFGNDCRNNIGNCNLQLMYDGTEELAYIKNYTNAFTDPKFSEFFSLDILKNK